MSRTFFKSFVSRLLGYVIIAMQGVLLALLAFDMLNTEYRETWKKYGLDKPSVTIYLNNLSEEQDYEVKNCFSEAAYNGHAFIIKKEVIHGQQGGFSGLKFGVFGDCENNDVSFKYRGVEIIGKDSIRKLLQSDDPEATLGIDKGSAYSIEDIPTIRFGDRIAIKKLDSLTDESGSMAGEYTIIAEDKEVLSHIVTRCAEISNVTPDEITKATRGSVTDGSFRTTAIITLIAVMFLVLTVFGIIITLRGIDKLGKMIMMGWSRSSFALGMFSDNIWAAIFTVPLVGVSGALLSSSSMRSELFQYFMVFGFFNLVLTILATGISLLIVYSISPTGAIKKRYPTKVLYGLGVAGYIGVCIAVVLLGLQIDSPINILKNNKKLMNSWEEVSDYLVLSEMKIGEDGSSFAGESIALDQDLYDWYKSVYKDEDVFLVNTSLYDDELIDTWREYQVYEHLPSEGLWMFSYSENYLKLQGVPVDEDVLERADKGTRIYLIPSSWSEEKKASVKEWIPEYCLRGIREGDIDTIFNHEQQIEFVEYDVGKEFFTWADSPDKEKYCQDPVILICTPENMTYFIDESLKATGIDGYIKMLPRVEEKGFLSDSYLQKYNLQDNRPTFLRVEKYMDGIQQDLKNTMAMYIIAFVIVSVIVISLMLCLASIFGLSNRNRLNVKKFLGYDFYRMYGSPITSLAFVSFIEIAIMVFKGARYGLIMLILLAVVEFLIFKKFMTGQELSHVISDFKEE
ncbi:MAG: hypothetical protein J5653_05065 [Clostridiales bacterium]|nr:hypothetical protein [Clostridiales bacterium]